MNLDITPEKIHWLIVGASGMLVFICMIAGVARCILFR